MLALGIPLDYYVNPKERQRIMEEIAKKGYAKDLEVHLRKKDGGLSTALETCHERYDADGKLMGYEGIFRDITDEWRADHACKMAEKIHYMVTGEHIKIK